MHPDERSIEIQLYDAFSTRLRRFPPTFLAGRGIGVTPTCASAVYVAP